MAQERLESESTSGGRNKKNSNAQGRRQRRAKATEQSPARKIAKARHPLVS